MQLSELRAPDSIFRIAILTIALFLSACADAAPNPPGRLVDVGGRNLHLYCTGSGSPTIVLEAGGGNSFATWYAAQPLLAKKYRVCSYDRAGFAFSDPRPGTRTIAGIVEDLHTLLGKSGEKPPYVLVGHSLGGQFVWKYAERYPDGVIGVVALDPNLPELRANRPAELNAAYDKVRNDIRGQRLAKIKQGQATGKWEEMGVPDGLPRDVKKNVLPLTATAKWWEARYAEGELPDVDEPFRPLTIPVIVVIAKSMTAGPLLSADLGEQLLATRLALAKKIVAQVPSARLIEVDGDHLFNEEKPQVVIDAVRGVIDVATKP